MMQLVKWTLKMRTRWYQSIHMISNSWLLYGARTFMLIAVFPLNSARPPRSSHRWLTRWLGPFTRGGFDISFTTWTLLVPQALRRLPWQPGLPLRCFNKVSVASHKTEGPSACIMFLGIVGTQRHTSCTYPKRNYANYKG